MHSALLVIEKKDAMDFDEEKAWTLALATVKQTLAKATQIEELAENVFLLPLRSELHSLAALIAACLPYRDLSYRVLFLNEAPEWISRPHKKPPHPSFNKDLPKPDIGAV